MYNFSFISLQIIYWYFWRLKLSLFPLLKNQYGATLKDECPVDALRAYRYLLTVYFKK